MKFVDWYFSKGLKGFFSIWENYLEFFWRIFSIRRLFQTLFSYWRKDIVPHDWRGWRPIKATQVFMVNQFFRVFGAIVRFCVILLGLFAEAVAMLVGTALFGIWITLPLLVLTMMIVVAMGHPSAIIGFVGTMIFFAIVFKAYQVSDRIPYDEMSLEQLQEEDWFERFYKRTGITKEELAASSGDDGKMKQLLKSKELSEDEFNKILKWEIAVQQAKENAKKFWSKQTLNSFPPLGRHWAYGYTVHLDEYARDISSSDHSEYRNVELVGYEEELEMVRLALDRRDQNNVLLIGEAGIGKKSAIHYLAKLVREGRVEGKFDEMRLMLIDLGEAVSSAVDRGSDPEHVLHTLFNEAANAGNVILVLENLSKYLGTKKDSSVNIGAVLDNYLALTTFRVLATSTKGEFHRVIEKHKNIMKDFEVVEILEPTEEETMLMLLDKFQSEERDGVVFSFVALRAIIKKSDQLGRIVPLPERAIDLAYETLLYWKKNPTSLITPETVNEVITMKTGVVHGEIKENEREVLLNLESVLHQRVVGQDGAITQIADVIRKMRAGIGNEKKPVGSFLFLGPTGVGKTETAKALAEAYFGDEERMIRFDMSEFQAQNGLDRLIGSQQNSEPGILTSKIKDNPFSLVLLDELEKAHPKILDIFLQVLDEGMITDAFGERVSFRGAIIIATSNAGAKLIKDLVQKETAADEIRKKLVDYVVNEGIYRVEFLNRFDDVIFFRVLSHEQLVKVVGLMLNRFAHRLETEKNMDIEFEDGVIEAILERGYDPVFGARSVNRYIGDKIEDMIAKKIIAGKVQKGGKVVVGVKDIN